MLGIELTTAAAPHSPPSNRISTSTNKPSGCERLWYGSQPASERTCKPSRRGWRDESTAARRRDIRVVAWVGIIMVRLKAGSTPWFYEWDLLERRRLVLRRRRLLRRFLNIFNNMRFRCVCLHPALSPSIHSFISTFARKDHNAEASFSCTVRRLSATQSNEYRNRSESEMKTLPKGHFLLSSFLLPLYKAWPFKLNSVMLKLGPSPFWIQMCKSPLLNTLKLNPIIVIHGCLLYVGLARSSSIFSFAHLQVGTWDSLCLSRSWTHNTTMPLYNVDLVVIRPGRAQYDNAGTRERTNERAQWMV